MKGNLIFVKHYNWIGRRIRKLTKSEYNHVGIFIDEMHIVEAKYIGVRNSNLKVFELSKAKNKLDYAIYKINIEESKLENLINFAKSKVGAKYDLLQLLSIGIFILFGINKKYEPIDGRNQWICSELIAEGAENSGFKFSDTINADIISPADILHSGLVKRVE